MFGKKIKEIKKRGYSAIPYNRFFPFRIVYENGLLQNIRDYSIVYRTENMDIPKFGEILKNDFSSLQIVIDSDGYFIIPTIQDNRKNKKGEIFSVIENLKNDIPGTQLDRTKYLKQIQQYLNKEGGTVNSVNDIVNPKIRANINHVVCCNSYYRTLYLRFIPEKVDSGFLKKVLNMPESLVSIHIKHANIEVSELQELHNIEYKRAASSMKIIEKNLQEGVLYFYVGVYIMLSSGDFEKLDKKTNELLRGCPSIIDTATHNQEEGIISVLPFGTDKLQILTLISEKELYSLLPNLKGGCINELEHIY